MSPRWKNFLKAMVPAGWRRRLQRLVARPIYSGYYRSWAEAAAASGGYADVTLLAKTLAAARAVRDGRAAWERDTVLFAQPAANGPLLAALRRAAEAHGGRLELVDFGGSLGSTWWQHRPWLSDLDGISWNVVEQFRWVEAGRREFTVGPLRFYSTLAECLAVHAVPVLLLSSVLPYLESPHALLAEARERGFRHIIIDRTGFVRRGPDRLTVQRVSPEIYVASYPCWFFDREALLRPFAQDWRIVAEWPADDEVDIDATHQGLMLERIQP